MGDHNELIAEMSTIEKMKTEERLKYAKKRRAQQLKRFAQYERQQQKQEKKRVSRAIKNKSSSSSATGTSTVTNGNRGGFRVKFDHQLILLEAAARNDITEVRNLLGDGDYAGLGSMNLADVSNEDGLTALHQCCIDDYRDMVRLLLEHNANVNARDVELWTPLHAAATCGHLELAKILVEYGADLLAVNADGNMPYDICEDDPTLAFIENQMASKGVTQELIDDTRLCYERQMIADIRALAAEQPTKTLENVDMKDKHGATPLHIAAANGYTNAAKLLIDLKAPIEARDNDGWTPLHAAACWGQPMLLELLALHGADLDAETKLSETAYDLCDDAEFRTVILEVKERLRAAARQRSDNAAAGSTSSLTANGSAPGLRPRGHRISTSTGRSASIRRTSFKEKRRLSWLEARDERRRLMDAAPASTQAQQAKSTPESLSLPSLVVNNEQPVEIDRLVTDIDQHVLSNGDGAQSASNDNSRLSSSADDHVLAADHQLVSGDNQLIMSGSDLESPDSLPQNMLPSSDIDNVSVQSSLTSQSSNAEGPEHKQSPTVITEIDDVNLEVDSLNMEHESSAKPPDIPHHSDATEYSQNKHSQQFGHSEQKQTNSQKIMDGNNETAVNTLAFSAEENHGEKGEGTVVQIQDLVTDIAAVTKAVDNSDQSPSSVVSSRQQRPKSESPHNIESLPSNAQPPRHSLDRQDLSSGIPYSRSERPSSTHITMSGGTLADLKALRRQRHQQQDPNSPPSSPELLLDGFSSNGSIPKGVRTYHTDDTELKLILGLDTSTGGSSTRKQLKKCCTVL